MTTPNTRSSPANTNPNSYERVLAEVVRDLSELRATLLGKLSREIKTLQAQKQSLLEDIQRLQAQRDELELQLVAQQGMSQQDALRQQWIDRLARAIAVHLRVDIDASNEKVLDRHTTSLDRHMIGLDNALHATFEALERDLQAHQREVERQLQRMQSQKLQGEMLLASLIERIDSSLAQLDPNGLLRSGNGAGNGETLAELNADLAYVPLPPVPKPAIASIGLNAWWRGFLLVLGASLVLSLQNVLLRVLFTPNRLFGVVQFGALLAPTAQNSLAVLLLRMAIATPAMWWLATQGFGVPVGQDIAELLGGKKNTLLWRVVLSSVLQFASFVLIFYAFATGMKAAVVTTLFFVFPPVTALLTWLMFGDRPTLQRGLSIVLVSAGIVLTVNYFGEVTAQPPLPGTIAALLSGVTFAGYIVTSQTCFKYLEPISFTTIAFSIILGLSLGSAVFLDWGYLAGLTDWPALLGMSIAIAATTLVGYLFTNFGTKLMGAAPASIVSATGPVFTALLAFFILADRLAVEQIVGVLLVSLGVGMLFQQNASRQRPS